MSDLQVFLFLQFFVNKFKTIYLQLSNNLYSYTNQLNCIVIVLIK